MERLRFYLRWRNINIALFLLILVALGIVLGPLALGGPRLLQVAPADGTANANPQAGVQITFSQWVRPDSLRQALAFDPPVEFTVSEPGWPRPGAMVVLVQPAGGLRYGAKYRLTIGAGVRNLLGRTLDAPATVAFATAPYVPVARFEPAAATEDVPLNAPITVEFGVPVVPADQLAAAADDPRLADKLPQPLVLAPETRGVGRWLTPTRFGFYPAESLHSATTYTASVREAISSDGRWRLEKPVAWSFTTARPLLAGARPFDGAADVPASGEVEVRLASGVDVASAGRSFSLRAAESGTPVPGAVEARAGAFLFKPAAPLQRGARYEALLAPGVRSAGGAPLNDKPVSWSFTVIGDLAVAQVEPPPDTTEVLTETRRISVRFNHPVVALTTIDAAKTLPAPFTIDPPLAGAGRWLDTSTYVFTPKDGLASSTGYRVRVAAGLQDQTGGALRQEYAWSFTTIMPAVYGSEPAVGAQYASPREPIKVIFNQPMSMADLSGAIRLRRDGADVPGTVAFGGIAPAASTVAGDAGEPSKNLPGWYVAFTPSAPLERGASYEITVAAGARAARGSGKLDKPFSATFQVAPPPRIATSEPANGASAVDPSGSIRLAFSAPMDWASVERALAIDPKPTQVYTSTSDTEYFVYFPLKPETDYRVTVGADARDRFGAPLGQDNTAAFHTGSLPPSLALAGAFRIGAYNAYVPARVPIQHVGTPNVSYALYRVAPAQAMALVSDYEAWNNFTPPGGALVKRADTSLPGERNEQRFDLLDLGQLEPGTYVVEVRAPGGLSDRQIMVVSPYALTIKRSGGELFVWAADLASGQPAADLALTAVAYGYDAATREEPREIGRTDANGILKAKFAAAQPFSPIFLWSPAGARFAFGTTNWGEGINPWDFGLPADYAGSNVVGSVHTDRPIYRPEQNVYIRGAVRQATEGAGAQYVQPSDRSVFLTISDPEGSAVFSTTLALSEFGTFNTSFPLDRSAKLGTYTIGVGSSAPQDVQAQASLKPQAPSLQLFGSFSVAEYRKPAFEVAVTPAKPDLIQGDTLAVSVTARYFSGGAVAKAPLRWRLLANPFFFSSDSAPGYTFADFDDAYAWYRGDGSQPSPGGELVADGASTTDAQGNFTLNLPATLGKSGNSRTLTLDVEVSDVDGQAIAAQGTATVHAGAVYVGLRPDGYVVQAGQQQSVSLVTLDTQGAPAANRAVNVGIYKREWNAVRQQGADGRLYWTSTFSDTLIETQSAATDAQGRARVSFTPKEGGEYRVGAEVKDAGGHVVKSSAYTWVYGGDVFWGVDDTSRVDLIADKRSYKPGETAKVLVTAPYKGMRALMTIERGAVLEYKLLTLQDTTELLDVPIDASYAPNVYVSVVLIKPAGGDVPVPDLRVGIVNLVVSTERQELSVQVTPDKPQAGPGDQVTYTVKAADYAGKGVRAEIDLALVDKAVLALADDPNPSFRQAFYDRRPLGVFTAQTLTALVDRVTLKLQPGDKGGGGGAGAEVLVRRNFPDTAYWNPALVTGDDGTAKVTLTLPDSLTTWRMTARALTADTLVGQATNDLMATRPLLVRPALPRFLTVGDQAVLQAVVHNNTTAPIEATVTLESDTQGADRVALKLGADAKQTVQVSANGTAVVRWPVEAPGAGQALLRFTVAGGGLQDAVEQALPVQRYSTPEVVASAGQVLDETVETVDLASSQSPTASAQGQGELTLELQPSLAAGLSRDLSFLESYPYLCTEQTVSRFLPNAVTYRLYRQLGIADQQLKDSLDRNLAAGLQRLYALQHLDGGWGWWEDGDSQPYLTAYVVQGLLEARKAGYTVDQDRFDRGVAFLNSFLDNETASSGEQNASRKPQASSLNARAYVLFVLSEAGLPDRGRAIALFEQRDKLDIYARAYELMTLKALGEDDRARTLVGELMSTAILHAADAHWEERSVDYWNMSSDARTTALALQALVRADPTNFLIPNAVRYLMSGRASDARGPARLYARTTQEAATALIALSEYIAQSGELNADYTYRAALDGKPLKEGTVNRDNLTDPIDVVVALAGQKATADQSQAPAVASPSSLIISKTGKGRLYYTLRARYFADAARVQALDQGIGVAREYVAVDTDTLSPTGQLVSGARLGDLVQVRLTLTVPEDARYLAVEDMLPAGLEPLDTSLKTTSAAARGAELQGDDQQPYWWYFERTEIHDNRVALFATDLPKGTYHYTYLARATTAGAFKTLPATAYQMYAPDVFGRSAGATFTVSGQ